MTLQAIRSLLEFTRPYPWAIPVLVVLGLAASLSEGLGIGLIIPLLDAMLSESAVSADPGPLAGFFQTVSAWVGGDHSLLAISVLIIALVALKTAILAVDTVVSTSLIARAMGDLRRGLHRQLLTVGYEYFARVPQGKLVNLLDSQTFRASEALRALTTIVSSLSTIVVFSSLLLLLSWQLTLVVALLMTPIFLFVRLLAARAHVWGDDLVNSYSILAERILELLVSMRTIRIFNRETTEEHRFDEAVEDFKSAYRRTEVLSTMLPVLVEFLYVPVFLVVLGVAWYTQVGVPTVLVFMLLLYRLQNPIKQLNGSRVVLASYAAGIGELRALLDRSDKPYLESGNKRVDRLHDGVEFDRVTFAYSGGTVAAVKDVSVYLRANTVTAFVGDSGSGKSTLIHLLCRLYDPQSGIVRVDGVDLRELDLASWRARIAFAGQDADLLSGSIRFNIAYGADDASDQAIEEAARMAQAHDFIAGLPGGYDAEVGPRGTWLSGGQRQRIALARAILRRPDLLILDEATNAVDGPTEMAIQTAMERLAGETTVLLVAHRLNTLDRADEVIVMKDGQVVQAGPPEDLLAVPGPLVDLYSANQTLEAEGPGST